MFRKILVANDGSDGAKKAIQAAIDLAKRYGAELHEISVEERLPHYAETVGEVIEAKQEAAEYFRAVTREAEVSDSAQGARLTSHDVPGHEVETIVTCATDHGVDL